MSVPAWGAAQSVDRFALVAATLPLVMFGIGGNYEQPDPVHFAALVAGGAGLAAIFSRRSWAGAAILLAVLALGVYERMTIGYHQGSDVMTSTNEALQVLAVGGNPYAHVFQMTNPPGGVFGYPPGEIAFYGLAHLFGGDVFRVDRTCSILDLGLIAYLAPLVGEGLAALALGTLAVSGDLIFHATDGSNDTAASFLVLAGVCALAWSAAQRGRFATVLWFTAAVAFGWAIAFKEYASPIALFVALYLWRTDARRARTWIATAAATAAAFILPFLVWNPVAFIANVGGELVVHQNVWGRNLWRDGGSFVAPLVSALTPAIPAVLLAAVAGLTVALWRRPAASLGAAFLQGCAVVATVFVLARWTTSVYYVFLAPLAVTGAVLTVAAELGRPLAGTPADGPENPRG
jgi:hypothetical protein